MTVGSGGCSIGTTNNTTDTYNIINYITLPYHFTASYSTLASFEAQLDGYCVKNVNGEIIAWSQYPTYISNGSTIKGYAGTLTIGGISTINVIPDSKVGDRFIITVVPRYTQAEFNQPLNSVKTILIEIVTKDATTCSIQIISAPDITLSFGGSSPQYVISGLIST